MFVQDVWAFTPMSTKNLVQCVTCGFQKQQHPLGYAGALQPVAGRPFIAQCMPNISLRNSGLQFNFQAAECSQRNDQHSSAVLVLQYFLWYGILGTLFGYKMMWLTKLLVPWG